MRASASITSEALSALSRQPTARRRLVKLTPGVDDSGQLLEAVLDLADAAGAADALDGEVHVRGAVGLALDEQGEIARLGHGRILQRRLTRSLERNSRSPSRDSSMTRSHWPGARRAAPRKRPGPSGLHRDRHGRAGGRSDGSATTVASSPASGRSAWSRAASSTAVAPSGWGGAWRSTRQCRSSCACAAASSFAKAQDRPDRRWRSRRRRRSRSRP